MLEAQVLLGGEETPRSVSSVSTFCNVDKETRTRNFLVNLSRGVPLLNYHVPHVSAGRICIVGGGPSLPSTFHRLRFERRRGATVMALNGAGQWLLARGIAPDLHFVIDAKPSCAQFFLTTHPDTHYIIASHCDPAVFDALDGRRASMIHIYEPDMEEVYANQVITPSGKVPLLGGGSSVAMKGLFLAEYLGYTRQHLFGLDSCYLGDAHHAYEQAENNGDIPQDIVVRGKRFRAAWWHVKQADDYIAQVNDMRERGVRVTVHGEGLLAWIYRSEKPQ